MIDLDFLKKEAEKLEIELSQEALERFDIYARVLVDWNQRMNLTGITDPEGIVIRHFADSLTALTVLSLPKGARIIDVGTGAGFPGVPLKIARPDLEVTLLDSLNKRINFLNAVSQEIALPMQTVHSRAEDGGRNPSLREKFDAAVARAVTNLPTLCEYCLPFVKKNGCFLSMKGPDCAEEIASAKRALGALGSEVEKKSELTLTDGSGRTLILIRKKQHTAPQYPRTPAQISKAPF